MMKPQEHTQTERDRIVTDIVQWKSEEYQGRGEELPNEKQDEAVQRLRKQSDKELRKEWMHTVGEWLLHRLDMESKYKQLGPDAWLDEQYDALRNGEETAYGYVVTEPHVN